MRWSDDRGATAVEYGLIAALIAVVIVVAVALVGNNLLGSFTNTNDAVEAAAGVAPAPVGETTSDTAPAGADTLLTVTTSGGGATTIPLATWERIGNSGNYHWQCLENDFDLGAAARPVRLEVPSGPAPSCG